jgi:SAM-dependent methyltransferase
MGLSAGPHGPTARVEKWTDWTPYQLDGYDFTDFEPGRRVLDLGCGTGAQLAQLARRGCRAVGIDLDPRALERCRAAGARAVLAAAEAIPIRTGALDGAVCKVVIPYTHEARALGEIARALRPGGRLHACYHGAGYYLRYLILAADVRFRLYAIRTLVNTWFYAASGRVLPGFLGDTIHQTRGRLLRQYERHGLRLRREHPSPRFLGLPVFIYHTVERR